MDSWKRKLSKEDFTELEALLDLHQQVHSMELAASFTQGYRLGAAMVFEVYAERIDK